MGVIALDSSGGPLLVVLVALIGTGAAATPIVTSVRERRPLEAIAGGALGLMSLCWLTLAFMTEAFCDGTCGRDATTLYVAGSVGLVAGLLFAATIAWGTPKAVTWSLLLVGAAALGVGLARW